MDDDVSPRPGARRRRTRSVGTLAALLAGLAVATACDDVAGGDDESTDRAVAVYASVIRAVVEPVESPTGERLPVFVEHEDMEDGIEHDVQVGLVNELEEEFEIRFIDVRSEAVADDEPGEPVDDDGVLVGLGPIADGEVVTVEARRYRDQDDEAWFAVEVRHAADGWDAVRPPERIAPPVTEPDGG